MPRFEPRGRDTEVRSVAGIEMIYLRGVKDGCRVRLTAYLTK